MRPGGNATANDHYGLGGEHAVNPGVGRGTRARGWVTVKASRSQPGGYGVHASWSGAVWVGV
jgi:hypothetical protein